MRTVLVLGGLLGALGCQAGPERPDGSSPAFASIELDYEGCSCFEEVRELKLIAKELYGSFPWIDEPRQRIHIRLSNPIPLDLGELVRRVDGTHARTRSLQLEVTAALAGGEARISGTGQAIALGAPERGESPPAWRRFKVTGWEAVGRTITLALGSPEPPVTEGSKKAK